MNMIFVEGLLAIVVGSAIAARALGAFYAGLHSTRWIVAFICGLLASSGGAMLTKYNAPPINQTLLALLVMSLSLAGAAIGFRLWERYRRKHGIPEPRTG